MKKQTRPAKRRPARSKRENVKANRRGYPPKGIKAAATEAKARGATRMKQLGKTSVRLWLTPLQLELLRRASNEAGSKLSSWLTGYLIKLAVHVTAKN